jgi:hypothetical protein
MVTHVKQHYVPAFLLEQWHTPPDGKLSTFRWADGKLVHARHKAKAVAKEDHLYSMSRSSSTPDVRIERDFLGPHVDDPASIAHKSILAGGVRSLSMEQRLVWSRFLVSMMIRDPDMMIRMREHGRKLFTDSLNASPVEYLAARGNAPEETLSEWMQNRHPDRFDDIAPAILPRLVHSVRYNDAFMSAVWATRPIKRCNFDLMLGDRPLTCVGDFATTWLVVLPLAPKLAFVAFNQVETWGDVMRRDETSFVKTANLHTIEDAVVYAYATNADQQRFVEKYLRQVPRSS